jgi:hypothetical protein
MPSVLSFYALVVLLRECFVLMTPFSMFSDNLQAGSGTHLGKPHIEPHVYGYAWLCLLVRFRAPYTHPR